MASVVKVEDDDSRPGLVQTDSSDDSDINQADEEPSSNSQEETTQLMMSPHTETAPAAVPSPLDGLLSTYSSFSSKIVTADQGLKIIQWSSWAISYATSNTHKAGLSPALRTLYNEIGFARYVLRFYGFLPSLEGYRSGAFAGGTWQDGRIAKIAKYAMAGSMMAYYPLEHIAYAGWKMPTLVKVDANKFSAISCVFWTTYIVGDLAASVLKWRELGRNLQELKDDLVRAKRTDDKQAAIDILLQEKDVLGKIRHVKLQIARCLLFILPAVNWSLPKWATDPLLSELSLNGLMLGEAYVSVYQSLRSMLG